MKRKKLLLCGFITVMLLVTFSFAGCGKKVVYPTYADTYENLAKNATYIIEDAKVKKSLKLKNKKEAPVNSVIVDLQEQKEFNTIILGETTNSVIKFELYGSNELDKGYAFLHSGDTIEGMRVCYTGDVKYRFVKLVINGWTNDFIVNRFEVYNTPKSNTKNFRVTSYLVMNGFDEDSTLTGLEATTDVILFGLACFNDDGDIIFKDWDSEKNETIPMSVEDYKKKLIYVRSKVVGKNISLSADISLPNKASIIELMTTKKEKTISSIVAFVNEMGLDGYGIDFEYPETETDWSAYNSFIVDVKKALPEGKTLSVAGAGWNQGFTKEARESIDRFEIMTYDLFDVHGYHSTFAITAEQVQRALQAGFKPEQIDLGLPFYSRPFNREAYWGTYNQVADKLGKYENVDYETKIFNGIPLTPQYYNCYQMIADKTAFAIDLKLGGVMIWHLNCDVEYQNELSLYRAITETKSQKKS